MCSYAHLARVKQKTEIKFTSTKYLLSVGKVLHLHQFTSLLNTLMHIH